ncbi:uncharacterized protein LOC124946233 [Impatiens glandulifera]|uniref:uncharacterized protein LOC124946233 n=1 Tax=Impatiens glandulifera TaxID=253017 RepID=UPI001FB0DB0B|nr:uncharacterized protein LOC124946233 [Impatiens glandulifera]
MYGDTIFAKEICRNTNDGSQRPIYKEFMGFKLADFRGSTDPLEAEEWLQSMETIFTFMQCSNSDQVKCASFMFKDDARIWWQGAKSTLDLDAATWEEFNAVFYGKYFTLSTRNKLARKFLEIRLGDASIANYVKKFERGKYFAPMITGNADLELNHFLEGLNATIRRDVRISNASSLRETIEKALMAEKDSQDIVKEEHAKRKSYPRRESQELETKKPFQPTHYQNPHPQQARNTWPNRNPQHQQQQQSRMQPTKPANLASLSFRTCNLCKRIM